MLLLMGLKFQVLKAMLTPIQTLNSRWLDTPAAGRKRHNLQLKDLRPHHLPTDPTASSAFNFFTLFSSSYMLLSLPLHLFYLESLFFSGISIFSLTTSRARQPLEPTQLLIQLLCKQQSETTETEKMNSSFVFI